ncbi:hypothetical protein ES703_00678 [subsurface metagenome]
MKLGKRSKILGLVLSMVLLVGMAGMAAPALANGGVILHPGDLTGSVTVIGQNISQVTVKAMDTDGVFSAYVTVNVSGGASSIDYTLTVEGDRDYYVIADAKVVATDYTRVILPMQGPVNVPIEGTVIQNLSVDPAFISGTISTTTDSGNTIQAFTINARIYVPQFPSYFYNRTSNPSLSVPGYPDGRDYTLLVAPGLQYQFYANITINGMNYNVPTETVGPLAAGETLTRDFTFDVTAAAATISGTALLLGTATDVYNAYVRGYAPGKNTWTQIAIATGAYTLDVCPGTWNVAPDFYFRYLTGDLSGLYGFLRPPRTAVTVAAGDHVTQDFIIDPGFITGTVTLTGANTDIHSGGQIRATSSLAGYMYATIHPDTGEYMFVASPGDSWQYNSMTLNFDYPTDPDSYLRSNLYQYISGPVPTAASGETVAAADLTYGTATVRLYYYVEGGGELRSPYYYARRAESPYFYAYAYGSSIPTTEGQTIGTLFPGTYTIEAFANVGGSNTEFGTFTVSVEEGDVVVIGGPGRPTIQVTNPTEGEVIPTDSVVVEGTATDPEGIASITINGEDVTFTSTGNPDDPNEVEFSHNLSLDVGENTITVVATDVDPTPHSVTLTLTVTREEVATPTTLTYTGDTLVQVNGVATLEAVLVDEDGQPISDAEISFQVDGLSFSAVTGTDGVASYEVTAPPDAGVFEITADFAGDDLHEASTATALGAVYDPEGGFVTGGGWIESPEGAYAPNPTLTGRANFGFISKYKKGATEPTGQTEFQFQVADLNFHSESYQWLVVAGARAQYKGTGTINGEGNYGFMLTAIDAKLTPSTDVDMFRIKIWDKDTDAIVYDNQMGDADSAEPATIISGGNIVIHKG